MTALQEIKNSGFTWFFFCKKLELQQHTASLKHYWVVEKKLKDRFCFSIRASECALILKRSCFVALIYILLQLTQQLCLKAAESLWFPCYSNLKGCIKETLGYKERSTAPWRRVRERLIKQSLVKIPYLSTTMCSLHLFFFFFCFFFFFLPGLLAPSLLLSAHLLSPPPLPFPSVRSVLLGVSPIPRVVSHQTV